MTTAVLGHARSVDYMAGSLEPVVAKLNRAVEHYRFLKEEINDGRDALLHSVVCEPDPDGLNFRFRLGTVEKLDPRWPVVVGDAYFNLRATLDYLVFQLHVHHYGRRGVPDDVADDTAFRIRVSALTPRGNPIAPTSEWTTIRSLSIRDRATIERLQPYHLGRDGLDGLRQALIDIQTLNNIDKHRELHVVLSLPYAIPDVYFPPELGSERHPEFGIPAVSGAYIDRWSFTRKPPADVVDMYTGVLLTVGLYQGSVRYELLANLGGCIRSVWAIIERFVNRFPPLAIAPDFSWVTRSMKIM
jgi:hypothetical protein